MMPHRKGHESAVFISGCLVEILLANHMLYFTVKPSYRDLQKVV